MQSKTKKSLHKNNLQTKCHNLQTECILPTSVQVFEQIYKFFEILQICFCANHEEIKADLKLVVDKYSAIKDVENQVAKWQECPVFQSVPVHISLKSNNTYLTTLNETTF